MARSHGFFAQCFLFSFIMYFSQLRLAHDDIREAGVHVRTLVAAVQVGMLALVLSMQAVLRFVVGVVKRDDLSFALLGRSARRSGRESSCSRSVRSARSARSARSLALDEDAGLRDFDPALESPRGGAAARAGAALAAAALLEAGPAEVGGARAAEGPGAARAPEGPGAARAPEGPGAARAPEGAEAAALLEAAGAPELAEAPKTAQAPADAERGRRQFLADAARHHNAVNHAVEPELAYERARSEASGAPSPPPSLLSGGHSGDDGFENAIVFESNTRLDLYCLYLHCVGAVMYQTFLSFDYTLFNTQWIFVSGLLAGWTATALVNAYHRPRDERVRGAMWALFYTSVALAIQVSALVRWSWPEDTSMGVLATLYMPAFLAGSCWTTLCSEMKFAGARTSRGILFDSRRALPTFLLVTAVGALYSSPESRLSVVTYMQGLSRLATVHLLLLEPVLKFVSIYVLVVILERRKATDMVLAICFVQGLFVIVVMPAFDVGAITALSGCAVLLAVHATRLFGGREARGREAGEARTRC